MSGLLDSDSRQNDADGAGPVEAGGNEVGAAGDASAKATKPRQRRKRTADKPESSGAILGAASSQDAAEAPAMTESLIVPPADTGKKRPRPRVQNADGEPNQVRLPGEQARLSGTPSRNHLYAAPAAYGDSWAYDDPSLRDKRESARTLAIAGTVTLALAGMLYAAWPNKEAQVPGAINEQPIGADGQQAPMAGAAPVDGSLPPAETDLLADADAGLTPEERAGMASDAGAASSSLGQWFGSAGAFIADIAGPKDAVKDAGKITGAELASTSPSAASGPAPAQPATAPGGTSTPAPTGSNPSANAPAPQASSTNTATAAATTATTATATPAPTVELATARAVVPAQPASKPISAPPRWISGGPTDADNRGGRYRGSVVVQFTIQPGGRVTNCSAVRPSGNPQMDALTCRIVTERARFEPARNAQGQWVASQAHATYVWGKGRRRN